MDTVVNFLVEHLDSTMYANCEPVLLKRTLGELVLKNVDLLCEFYTEFDSDTLRIPLSVLAVSYHSFRQGEEVGDTLHNVVNCLKKNKYIWSFIPEVSLVKIILVMPAIIASSERAFRAL